MDITNYAKTETLTQDRVQELSKSSQNVMYEYEHDTVDRVKSSDEVKYLMRETMIKYKELRETHPEFCDRACRRTLLENETQLRDFKKTHPKIFDVVTNRDASPKDIEVIYFQLNIVKDVEAGKISYEMAMQKVQMHAVEICKTGISYEEWQEKQKEK